MNRTEWKEHEVNIYIYIFHEICLEIKVENKKLMSRVFWSNGGCHKVAIKKIKLFFYVYVYVMLLQTEHCLGILNIYKKWTFFRDNY